VNPDVKARWVTALRSGEYAQGRGRLRQLGAAGGTLHCCLGVLCELAAAEGVAEYRYGLFYGTSTQVETGFGGVLPYDVKEWAGLTSADPLVDGRLLSVWNDGERLSFEAIAEKIERYL
jgi:hypothetical protein